MAEPTRERMEQARGGRSLSSLAHVPIIPAYRDLLTRLLAEHGATLMETGVAPPKNVDASARMYTVTFPPGTVQVDGIVFCRSFPFVIHFPDGYALHGAQLWPITQHEGDFYIHALYLSDAEVPS